MTIPLAVLRSEVTESVASGRKRSYNGTMARRIVTVIGFASIMLTLMPGCFGLRPVPTTAKNDLELEQTKGLNQLEFINLNNTQVTDSGLQCISGSHALRRLWLSDPNISNAGLAHLRELNQLEDLDLGSTKVTDAGLEYLIGMSQLRRLVLTGTDVTDAGVQSLTALKQLRWLFVNDTEVTDKGVRKLKNALPSCQIYDGRENVTISGGE